MKLRRAVVALILATVSLLAEGTTVMSKPRDFGDYEVKAAFIYNFAKFVEWPSEAFDRPDAPIVIGIVGDDPFGSALERTTQGKQVNDRPFLIRRLDWGDEVRNRQILFLSGSDAGRARRFLDRVKGVPVLTIADQPGLARRGAVINFVVEQERVRFEINVEAARRARLTISSRLLSLAKVVSDGS
jgi:hypothetical protein